MKFGKNMSATFHARSSTRTISCPKGIKISSLVQELLRGTLVPKHFAVPEHLASLYSYIYSAKLPHLETTHSPTVKNNIILGDRFIGTKRNFSLSCNVLKAGSAGFGDNKRINND